MKRIPGYSSEMFLKNLRYEAQSYEDSVDYHEGLGHDIAASRLYIEANESNALISFIEDFRTSHSTTDSAGDS
jgi:hypothetical protein